MQANQPRENCRRACKPNFVEDGHSSRRGIAADVHQRPTRRFPLHRRTDEGPTWARRAGTRLQAIGPACGLPPYLVLLRVGFTLPPRFTAGAVRSYRTFSPLPPCLRPMAVCSLWHWPSRRLDAPVPDVIRHTALRSSDFPPPDCIAAGSGRPARLHFYLTAAIP